MKPLVMELGTVITKLNCLKTKCENTVLSIALSHALSNAPRLPKQRCFGKVPRLRPSVLLVRAIVDEDEYRAMVE